MTLRRLDDNAHRVDCQARIGRTYHRRRRQAPLGRLTPIEFEFETTVTTQVALAA